MRIVATDKTIHQIVKLEVDRLNELININAIDVDEINLNHIDVSQVTNMNELFKDFTLSKPLNIESWNFENIRVAFNIFNDAIEKTNPDAWRI
jgi:hypothetical protein